MFNIIESKLGNIRTYEINGVKRFVAKDILTDIIGYKNITDALKKVNNKEINTIQMPGGFKIVVLTSEGLKQFFNDTKSKKEKFKTMKEWAIESGLIPKQEDKPVITKLPALGEVFNNSEFGELEVLEIDGKPWFPAIECAEILIYTNPRKAMRDHCLSEGITNRSVLTEGGNQEKKYINEDNLYRLIIKSKLPSAQSFERWVFDEVLLSLRQNKGYVVETSEIEFIEKHFTGLSDNLKRMMVMELNENNKKLHEEIKQKNNIISVLQPKANF
ncbi:Bro-N domain-containing protein [Bacillus pseudomycoides]|uniref:BRO-N domain-containing protein n=1 Tax=Bacillus pseudomycoides TaxID=64104 RepID=UPI0001A167D9|nr:Bro-N domain-containing protein [Bacillus pseudomycoides]EEM06208.1 BRO [Bacillus pseudomycoides]